MSYFQLSDTKFYYITDEFGHPGFLLSRTHTCCVLWFIDLIHSLPSAYALIEEMKCPKIVKKHYTPSLP